MVSDRVGDFIVRLQNAAAIGKRGVSVPYSAFLLAISKKLKDLGYLSEVSVSGEVKKALAVELSYEGSRPRIRGVRRVSKPGRRLYAGAARAHTVKGGTGSRIFSTSRGIVSDAEARKNKVGGEELFEIW